MPEPWMLIIAGVALWVAWHKGWFSKLGVPPRAPVVPVQPFPVQTSQVPYPATPYQPNGLAPGSPQVASEPYARVFRTGIDPNDSEALYAALMASLDARAERQKKAQQELANQAKLDEMMHERIKANVAAS